MKRWWQVALNQFVRAMLTKKPEEPDTYFELRLTAKQRKALIGLLNGQACSTVMRNAIEDAVRTAQEFERLPIRLDWRKFEKDVGETWEKLMAEAEKRGSTIRDYLFDNREAA